MANDILYRPQLGLDKIYKTDGLIDGEEIEAGSPDSQSDQTRYDKTKESIEQIKIIKEELPEELIPNIDNIINTLEFVFVQIKEDLIENNDPNGTDNIDPDFSIQTPEYEYEPEDEDDWQISKNVPNIIIDLKEQNLLQSINKKYCNVLFEISNDYIDEFRKATTKYYMDLGLLIAEHKNEIGFTAKKYKHKTSDIKNNNLHHVSDYLIKSQIVRDQKQRMLNKLFNEYESLNLIKACEASRELLLRYTAESFKQNNTINDMISNMTLQESKLQYERKLDNNLFELYKYLNSSVILLDECLRLYIKEAQAKSILIKEEGISL